MIFGKDNVKAARSGRGLRPNADVFQFVVGGLRQPQTTRAHVASLYRRMALLPCTLQRAHSTSRRKSLGSADFTTNIPESNFRDTLTGGVPLLVRYPMTM